MQSGCLRIERVHGNMDHRASAIASICSRSQLRGPHHVLYASKVLVRAEPLRQMLFDENLPLYGYGEDYELSLRLKKYSSLQFTIYHGT
jgi:GT2 family glycosyltransferase